ncbi:TerD-family protein [Streptomyces sp. Ru73]|uniref:TerD family protein n=1 Tax=Streptomyces sp. Ru73 TaxID=2080748 RepID=UPI000CDDF2ED|nr:TerD family protein [Streptomyces sp. Ru73]POX37473.1 TerD-family protein [Streptomyces sp. Ru73]
MSASLTKGGNVSLSRQAPGLTAVTAGLGWQAGPGCDLDASALLCDRTGKVLSDEHFVFFNNLSSPDGSVTHSGGGQPAGGDRERIRVDLDRLPAEVTKVVFAVSVYEAEQRGQTFGAVSAAYIRLLDRDGDTELARYDLRGEGAAETAMVFGELYRHGAEWKFRAVGQGYASGLAGIATDYGVDVLREAAAGAGPAGAPAAPPPATGTADKFPPAPATPPPSAPVPHTPTVAVPQSPPAAPHQPTGSSAMTCFFDPQHGPGTMTVMWSPQWGVPRQIQACGGCAQRVQTTPPPYYTDPQQAGYAQAGYPQAGYGQAGYPQPGYAQPTQPGYAQHGHAQQYDGGHHGQGGRRFGTGALIGAGAAGLVGGALLNEAFDDDEPDVIVNNYYEEE